MEPTTPETSASAPVATQPETKKDNHGITIAALAVFILLALGAVAFLYYQNQQLKTMLASYQTPVSSPTPSASPDVTANWKIYTSKDGVFSFKYPADSVIDKDLLTSDGSIEFNNFILFREMTGDTLSAYVNKLKDTNSEFQPLTKTVGLLSTMEWVGFYKNTPSYYVSITNNGYVYSLGLVPFDNVTNPTSTTNLFDQILSTFKFIDSSASPSAKPVACTQEAKICPDGSSVGRTGPNCEFAPCPTP